MYKLAIKKSARKELDDLPDQEFLKIDKAIFSLRDNPFPYPQSKKLKGDDRSKTSSLRNSHGISLKSLSGILRT